QHPPQLHKRGRIMRLKNRGVLALMFALAVSRGVFAQTPSFSPDGTFEGAALTAWHTLGDAKWSADGGVIAGDGPGNGAGWLVSNQSFQDTGVYASFECEGLC